MEEYLPERQVSQGKESPVTPSALRKKACKNKNSLNELISPVRSLYFKDLAATAGRKAARQRDKHSEAEGVNI